MIRAIVQSHWRTKRFRRLAREARENMKPVQHARTCPGHGTERPASQLGWETNILEQAVLDGNEGYGNPGDQQNSAEPESECKSSADNLLVSNKPNVPAHAQLDVPVKSRLDKIQQLIGERPNSNSPNRGLTF